MMKIATIMSDVAKSVICKYLYFNYIVVVNA